MAFRQLLICFLLLLYTAVTAQQTTGFHVQQYGTEDGLPSNGIKGMQWDKHTQFLWIATEAGMVRYNGISFKTYTHEDEQHITTERMLFLVRNNAGAIFTADNTGNIFTVNKNSLSFFEKKSIAGNSKSNTITLSVSDVFYNTRQQIENGPFALQFDKALPISDTAFYILHSGQLYYFSLSLPSPVLLLNTNARSAFMSNSEIFLSDAKSNLWRFDKQKKQLVSTSMLFENGRLTNETDKNLFLWENGMDNTILINTNKAWKLLFQNGKLIARLICNQVPQDALIRYAQYDEPTNTLFIGTDSKGLIIIKQNQVEALRKERTNANQRTSYYSQAELPDGNIITNEGHILGKNSPEKTQPPFKGNFSNGTFMMGDSLFWFVQVNNTLKVSCLHNYNFKTRKLTAFKKIKDNFSQLVMAKSGGNLFLANEYGIYKMQADSLQPVYTYPVLNKLRTNFDMKEIKPGVLAIANCNSLLSYTIATNKLDTIYTPGNYCVRTIWVYNDYLFFGTYGNGFFISKNGKVKAVPLDKNRYLLFTHCFINDGNGFCWISTNRGLFKVSIEDMINAYETDAAQVYYHYFGRNDGMNMTEMNGGCMPCGLMLSNKTISFPTMEGMLWVNPQTVNPVLPNGEIFIDEILIDNKRTEALLLEQKPLTAANHDIQIRLGFSAWGNKENIYLEYQLNKDTVWKSVNTDNGAVIQLNNISKGNYVLRIRKLNGFGINNYSYKEIRFAIPTPWYQQWWFYLLSLAVAWGLLVLYFRFRTSQLKQRQRNLEKQVDEKTKELQHQNELLEKSNSIKTRLISIISHDIVTPLKFLTVAGKNLQEKRAQMPEALQQETIEEMTNTSQELQLLSTNILNWIKYQNENRRMSKESFYVHEVVEQVLGLLKSFARQKKVELINETDKDLLVYQYFEPLKILVYNLLTNAINFSEKNVVAISCTADAGTVTLFVKDKGVGMEPAQIQNIMADQFIISSTNIDKRKGNGLGYLIIKDLVKMMDATLHIESKKNEGTTVSIVMPSLH